MRILSKKRLVFGGFLLTGFLMFTVSCGVPAAPPAPNDASAPGGWLTKLKDGSTNNNVTLTKYCDNETGNLIYIYDDKNGSMVIVANGCSVK